MFIHLLSGIEREGGAAESLTGKAVLATETMKLTKIGPSLELAAAEVRGVGLGEEPEVFHSALGSEPSTPQARLRTPISSLSLVENGPTPETIAPEYLVLLPGFMPKPEGS